MPKKLCTPLRATQLAVPGAVEAVQNAIYTPVDLAADRIRRPSVDQGSCVRRTCVRGTAIRASTTTTAAIGQQRALSTGEPVVFVDKTTRVIC